MGNGYSEEAMNKLWDILEPFAKYAFNKCLHGDTEVLTSQNTKTTVKDLYHRFKNGEKNIKILSMFEGGGLHFHNISEIVQTGRKPLWTVETESGKTIKITENHRMLTTNGYRTIKSGGIQVGSELIDDKYWNNRFRTVQRRPTPRRGWSHKSISYHEVKNISFSSDVDKTLAENYLIARGAIFETNKIISSPKEEILGTADFFVNGTYFEMDSKGLGRQHLIDSKYGTVPFVYLTPENYRDEIDAALMSRHISSGDKVVSITPPEDLGDGAVLREMTYDITMSDDGPANFIANGLVSHNSHSVAYAMNAYQAAYLKTHYPVEFMSALVAQTISDRDKTLNNLREARRMGLTMGTVDINLSEVRMAPDYSGESPFEILYGISGVKSVSEDTARLIVAERERGGRFTSVYDAVTRCVAAGVNNKTVLVNLALAGAFDGLEPNRRRVVEAIPALLSVGRDEFSKGMSLLAALDVPGEDIFMMPDVEDYSYTDRLGMEADMVGLYLSGHPMDHADLSPFGATPLKAVASAASGFGSGTARVVAAVSGIEMRTTGRGKMCTLHLDDGDGFLSVRLSPKVISGVEKFEAMEDIKTRFCKGEMEVPKSTVAKALKDVPVVETIRQNMVYVMDVTYRRMFGGGQGSVRVDSIRPVTFTHDGGLPVRVRINVDRLGVDRARKAYVAIPRMLAEKTPGSTPIMIAHYRLGDGTVTSDEDRCRYALEVMRREKAAAGSSDDTRKGKKKSGSHDTGGSGGKTLSLLGDDNDHDESETRPHVKDTVGRQWPTEVPAEFIKGSEAGVDDMRSFADALEYRDTGLTAAPSTDTSRILEKYLGHENYDFGMYVPVVAYS